MYKIMPSRVSQMTKDQTSLTQNTSTGIVQYLYRDRTTPQKKDKMNCFKDMFTPPRPRTTPQPDYDVIHKGDGYEERRYSGGHWVCTDVKGLYHEQSRIEGFKKLQAYIAGQNEKGVQLLMAVPILTKLSPNNMSGFENWFTVCMYLPIKHGVSAPQPTCPDVYVQELPAMTVFVRKFEGVTNDEKWICEAKELAESLRDIKEFHTDFYFTAGYNSPFSLVHRTNEVWLVQNVLDELNVSSEQTILPSVQSDASTKLVQTVLPSAVSTNLPPVVNLLLAMLLLYVQFLKACIHFCMYSIQCITNGSNGHAASGFVSSAIQNVQQVYKQIRRIWLNGFNF